MTNALDLTAPVDTWRWSSAANSRPATALFRAHADPELVKQWLGPHGLRMDITEWEFRSHGGYRYSISEESGSYGFNGTFHTVRDNDFILQTFEFEGAPDMVNIEYLWFEDLGDGRSRLRGRSICPNTEARDALLSSGMEGGMAEGYQKLDALLAAG
jgi:uncharacterized protein YndB with AHSA1/START domain